MGPAVQVSQTGLDSTGRQIRDRMSAVDAEVEQHDDVHRDPYAERPSSGAAGKPDTSKDASKETGFRWPAADSSPTEAEASQSSWPLPTGLGAAVLLVGAVTVITVRRRRAS
ncbi:hypothetical protein [Streptomyces tirandamycinicus]|uniref:hypothetical protein n=1 Tax=Streptomyces tirandamycinicus TaxID=2174846 RepID=UPI001ABF22A0|nr:hypothetical protein [Streptomyces tirandamycinicus]